MTDILLAPCSPAEEATRVRWRHLGWMVWRQHRGALAATAAVLGALCLLMLVYGLTARAHDLGRAACGVAQGCTTGGPVYSATYAGSASTTALALQIVPGLLGAFVGAPLLARELESGTFRFAWTQACGRTRWLVAKLVLVAVAVTAAAAAVSAVTWWYLRPFVGAGLISGIRSPGFNVRGIDFAAWTLVAFAVGVLAGGLMRRVVPAMVATLAAWFGLFFITLGLLRPHYLAPLVGSSNRVTVNWWIVGQAHAGADVLYQPESRFWTLQLIEGAWLLALAALLLGCSVWLVRRRTR